jgi:hypothetical protein
MGQFGMLQDNADDISLLRIRINTEEQVRRSQVKEMEDMGLKDLAVMHKATHFFGNRCQVVAVTCSDNHIHSLGRRKMMADRTDPAESLNQDRPFPEGTAADKAFKAAKFDNMETAFRDLVVIVQVDGYLAVSFNPSERFNGDFFRHNGSVAPVSVEFNQILYESTGDSLESPEQLSCFVVSPRRGEMGVI